MRHRIRHALLAGPPFAGSLAGHRPEGTLQIAGAGEFRLVDRWMAEEIDAVENRLPAQVASDRERAVADVLAEQRKQGGPPALIELQPGLHPLAERGGDFLPTRGRDDDHIGQRGGIGSGPPGIAILEDSHFPDIDLDRDGFADFASEEFAGPESARRRDEVFIDDDDLEFPVAGFHAGDVAALFDQMVHWVLFFW